MSFQQPQRVYCKKKKGKEGCKLFACSSMPYLEKYTDYNGNTFVFSQYYKNTKTHTRQQHNATMVVFNKLDWPSGDFYAELSLEYHGSEDDFKLCAKAGEKNGSSSCFSPFTKDSDYNERVPKKKSDGDVCSRNRMCKSGSCYSVCV